MTPRVQSWLLVLGWAAVIFTLSTAAFSDAHTGSVLIPLFHWLLPRASFAQLEFLHTLTRKGAHLFEYFVFAWLLLIAVRSPERGWKLRWALLALAIAAVYAASDEFHQIFVPGRGPSVWDSLLDTVGAAIALATAWLAARIQHLPQNSSTPHPS